jgi:hypothetical protein
MLLPGLPVFADTLFKQFNGIRNLFFIQLRNTESGTSAFLDRMLSPNDFITLVRVTGFLRLQGFPVQIMENPVSNVVANCLYMKWLPKSPEITRYGKIIVLRNGDITSNHSSRYSYGTYRDGKLEKVLASARYLEDTGSKKVICLVCEFYKLCQSLGMNHPSSKDHNNTLDEVAFCKKVLQKLKE